jgi:hypothetical protein
MTISAILILKFDRDEIGIGTVDPPFFFYLISLDLERICRYFRLNLLVPRFSMGINCYSLPLQRNLSSKSQDKSHFHYLSLITDQDEFISM